jgi:hypothetical protein
LLFQHVSTPGFIRKSSIYPLGRCKAGHLSVPCPRKPLDVLRVVMPGANFTEHCLALPDVAQRQLRGYTDDEQWIGQPRAEMFLHIFT